MLKMKLLFSVLAICVLSPFVTRASDEDEIILSWCKHNHVNISTDESYPVYTDGYDLIFDCRYFDGRKYKFPITIELGLFVEKNLEDPIFYATSADKNHISLSDLRFESTTMIPESNKTFYKRWRKENGYDDDYDIAWLCNIDHNVKEEKPLSIKLYGNNMAYHNFCLFIHDWYYGLVDGVENQRRDSYYKGSEHDVLSRCYFFGKAYDAVGKRIRITNIMNDGMPFVEYTSAWWSAPPERKSVDMGEKDLSLLLAEQQIKCIEHDLKEVDRELVSQLCEYDNENEDNTCWRNASTYLVTNECANPGCDYTEIKEVVEKEDICEHIHNWQGPCEIRVVDTKEESYGNGCKRVREYYIPIVTCSICGVKKELPQESWIISDNRCTKHDLVEIKREVSDKKQEPAQDGCWWDVTYYTVTEKCQNPCCDYVWQHEVYDRKYVCDSDDDDTCPNLSCRCTPRCSCQELCSCGKCPPHNLKLIAFDDSYFTKVSEWPETYEIALDCDTIIMVRQSPKNEPVYYLSSTPITNSQWQAVMGNKDNSANLPCDKRPVSDVSYNEVNTFISTLNKSNVDSIPFKFNLPSVEEWKWAEKKINIERHGNECWHKGNSAGRTHSVGLFRPTQSLYDMIGNVSEYVVGLPEGADSLNQDLAMAIGTNYNDYPPSNHEQATVLRKLDKNSSSATVGFRLAAIPNQSLEKLGAKKHFRNKILCVCGTCRQIFRNFSAGKDNQPLDIEIYNNPRHQILYEKLKKFKIR